MPKLGGFSPISIPAARHHEYVTTIGGEKVSDNAAWLHQAEADDCPDIPVPLTGQARLLTPAEKAAATRQRKADLAATEAATSARQQARRERFQSYADKFPVEASLRQLWLTKEKTRWWYPEGSASRVDVVPDHHRVAAPKHLPVFRRIWTFKDEDA